MKIPGIERDDDGSLVIEISPTMRLVALASVMILVGVVIWWLAIAKEQAQQRKMSRVPQDIIKEEEFAEDKPDALMKVEEVVGVSPHSLLSIERVAGADREELEKIFNDIMSQGLPRLDSEEAQLFNGLIERSAEIAPNRSLRFYDMLEGNNQRPYAINQLYKTWIGLNPLEALETAKLVEEPLRFHTLARDLPALAETRPKDAFDAALITRGDYFTHVRPDFVRPVTRIWARNAFSEAEKAVFGLSNLAERKEAVQGLALAKLDQSSEWENAYEWATGLGNSEDRLWARLTLVELGIHKDYEGVSEAAGNFSNQSLKQHLLRLMEAKRLALEISPGERHEKTWQIYRSTDPYDAHGRLCVLNTLENVGEREFEAITLRSRWPEIAEMTFVADGYLLYGGVPLDIPQKPLVNLLERGDRALSEGDLESSRQDFLTYLHYNPGHEDVDPYFTRWSKEAGTWLGNDAVILDEVIVPANVIPETSDFFVVMDNLAKEYEKETDKKLDFYIFEAISGRKPETLYAWGEHGDVSLREALDVLTSYSGLTVHHKEYGIVGYYWRDEDIAMSMGTSIESIPYPIEDQ